jgi:hypothetical protein
MANEPGITTKVDTVFASVARGDAADTDALLALGDAIVPAVTPYLSSTDAKVRTEAVALLAALRSAAAATALLPALADMSADVGERAAEAVLAHVEAAGAMPGLDSAVAKALLIEDPGASVLLLGAFSPASTDSLRKAAGATRLVKLTDADLPVEAGLAARVSLARLGDLPARSALEQAIEQAEVADLLFLLDVLPLLDDPSLIHALAAHTLDDTHPAGGGVPAEVEPARRVCDHAVDALAARLRLKLSFAPDGISRYTDAEIAEVRRAVGEAIPN